MSKEYELRGFYKPNFFSIYIGGEFDKELKDMSLSDSGTFVHEYVHYLQNITTSLGLRASSFYYTCLSDLMHFIANQHEIILPVKLAFNDGMQNNQLRFTFFDGEKNIFSTPYKDIDCQIVDVVLSDTTLELVQLNFHDSNSNRSIILGNRCVKESMASLYQRLFDNTIYPHDIPYNTVELLCSILNPELLKDKRKIISLCYLSLSSQNSGLFLYELILESKKYNDLNGVTLYKKLFTIYPVSQGGNMMSIKSFLLNSIDLFRVNLNASLVSELNYFVDLLSNIRNTIKKGDIPLIDILYQDTLSFEEKINHLIAIYGIPIIRSQSGNIHLPSDSSEEVPAEEYVELMAQNIVFERVLGMTNNICGLIHICQLDENMDVDECCYEKQWNKANQCPFRVFSDFIGLTDKLKEK